MKKKETIILILVLFFIIFIGVRIGISTYHDYEYWLYDVGKYAIRDFRSNKESFELTAEKALDLFNDEKEKNNELKYISITMAQGETWKLDCVVDPENRENDYISLRELSRKEYDAYTSISRAFAETDSRGLYFIKVTHNRVVFASGTPYAIIYMKDGKTPKYIIAENENYDSIFMDKLSTKWFQAVGK